MSTRRRLTARNTSQVLEGERHIAVWAKEYWFVVLHRERYLVMGTDDTELRGTNAVVKLLDTGTYELDRPGNLS